MNKTVLLTGATGFLGSHLLAALLENQYRVIIYKRSFSNTGRIIHLLDQVTSYDLDRVSLEKAFKEERIDVVIHTATHYGRNNDPASKILETNTIFPLRLLETAIDYNTHAFFNTDTFFNTEGPNYQYLINYTLSKKHFSDWLKNINIVNSHSIKRVNLKLEHVYGPNDDPNKFVPWILIQLLDNVDVIPLTPGEQKRDMVYVLDVVSAYLLLLKNLPKLDSYCEYEIGSGQAVSIKDLTLKIKNTVNRIKGVEVSTRFDFGAIQYRRGEFMDRKANIAPLLKFGWKPAYDITTGLDQLVLYEANKRQDCLN